MSKELERRAVISERLGEAFEQCVHEVVSTYGDGSRRAKLKLARQLLGMTQREFAVAFGLNPITVRNWEAESRPDPSGVGGAFIDLISCDPIAMLDSLRDVNLKSFDVGTTTGFSDESIGVRQSVSSEKPLATGTPSRSGKCRGNTKLAAPYIVTRKCEPI